jgi:hypothetical protein
MESFNRIAHMRGSVSLRFKDNPSRADCSRLGVWLNAFGKTEDIPVCCEIEERRDGMFNCNQVWLDPSRMNLCEIYSLADGLEEIYGDDADLTIARIMKMEFPVKRKDIFLDFGKAIASHIFPVWVDGFDQMLPDCEYSNRTTFEDN